MDSRSKNTKSHQTRYKNSGRHSPGHQNTIRRNDNVQRRKANRADKFASNRGFEEEPQEQPAKKLPWIDRYKLWKVEKDAQRMKEKEMKKKPVFKPGGAYSAPSLTFLPRERPISAKVSTVNIVPNTIKQVNNKKSKNAVKKVDMMEQTMAIARLSLDVAESKEKQNGESEKVDSKENTNPETDTTRIKYTNERNEIRFITPTTRVTRSRRGLNTSVLNVESNNVRSDKNLKDSLISNSGKEIPKVKAIIPESIVPKGPNPVKQNNKIISEPDVKEMIETDFKTPEKLSDVAEYVSPFVTTSRGKQSARQEKLKRQSLLTYPEDNSPQHCKIAAEYHRKILDDEIECLTKLYNDWEQYRETNKEILSEDTCDMINVAICQTKLLIKSKFEQFRGLINKCELGSSEDVQKVTPTDLMAFWDMVFMQVDNINIRFNRLTELRNNDWIEIASPIKIKKKEMAKKTLKPVMKMTTRSSSNIRAAINAGRKKQKGFVNIATAVDESTFDAGFFKITSPRMKVRNGSTPQKIANQSLLLSVLNSETNKKMNSPWTATTLATKNESSGRKKGNLSSCSSDIAENTPSKSILKAPGLNRSTSAKAVAFRKSNFNERLDFDETLPTKKLFATDSAENLSEAHEESINLMSWESPKTPPMETTPRATPRRRSTRINGGVLT